MGGGDLNTKKSWHPNTFKNQERVWKAEQADAAEKRKLAELQHEINEERNREELKTIAKKSGLLPDHGDGDQKLEWMYKGPSVNREEYLLGRTVDKNFEMLDAQEKATASGSGSGVGISQPKNHVEHECIPFSIRQYKGLEGTEQVDMARKLMEDPLMQIKQKEVESRQKILENPVKLKELHRLLKSDQSIRERDRERDRKGGKKKDKDDKRDKKKKLKKKRKGSDASFGSDNSDGGDLDKILAEKYKKVQNSIEKQEEVSLDKLLSMKYQKLSKELNKLAKPKKSKKKKDRRRNRSSDDSESDSDSDSGRELAKRRRDSSRERNRPGSSRVRERSRSRDHHRNRSKSPKRREDRKRSRSPVQKPSRKPAPRGRRTPVPSSSSESSPEPTRRIKNDSADDEEERRPPVKNFGLVSASGKKLELNKRDEVRLYKREEIRAHQSNQKPSWTKPERKAPLTEEEMDAKRRAMMSNAEWRDRERQKNVKRYDDEDRKLEERDGQKRYDKDFIMKQFKHAANNETVEKRIKSNRNNIQRSGGSMNDNFARR